MYIYTVGYCRVACNDTHIITHITFINVIESLQLLSCGLRYNCRAEFSVRHWARPSDVGCSQRVGLL